MNARDVLCLLADVHNLHEFVTAETNPVMAVDIGPGWHPIKVQLVPERMEEIAPLSDWEEEPNVTVEVTFHHYFLDLDGVRFVVATEKDMLHQESRP